MNLVYRLNDWLSKHWRGALVLVLAVLFAIGTSLFSYLAQSPDYVKWSSPDETANYLMAKQLAQTGQLQIASKYNLLASGIVAPRSLEADGMWLKPVSFLGIMIWYGTLAKIFGIGIIPYLTPILGAIGLIFFYLLIKKLFNQNNAVLSTVLLASFPVYVYYSARSLFHNVPFVVFLIIGVYLAVLASDEGNDQAATFSLKRKYIGWGWALLSGLALGTAIAMRASELIWLGPILLLLWLFNIRRWALMKPFLFIYGILVALAAVFYFNYVLYGSPLASGYQALNQTVAAVVESGSQAVSTPAAIKFDQAKQFISRAYNSFFYFGFKPRQSWSMFNHYVVIMFPWLWYLGVAGLIIFCFKFWRRPKSDLVYLLSLIIIGFILVLYYGSWQFSDNINPNRFTIGNSYTRYWLPLYLMGLPLVSLAILKLSRIFKNKTLVKFLPMLVAALLTIINLWFVLFGSEEALVPNYKYQLANRAQFNKVMALTEPQSIIITRYHDKVFFPERQVIVGWFDNETNNALYAGLVKRTPLYYYNFYIKDEDLKKINNEKLKPLKLELVLKEKITSEFGLYALRFR